VPFSRKIRASWGILNDSSMINVVNKANIQDSSITRVTWSDYGCVAPVPAMLGLCGGVGNWPRDTAGGHPNPDSGAVLMDHARLNAINFTAGTYAGTRALPAGAANGTGFLIYLNGAWFMFRMSSLPAAATVWHMRAYSGAVTHAVGSYGFLPARRPPAVPGLRMRISYAGTTLDPSVTTDSLLANIHTVPDPYYVTNELEITTSTKVLRFVNLPSQAIIRIYSVSGILVNIITHNDATGGGEQVWNLRNRNNQFVASGVYFYHVETPDGRTKIGRFTVVNYAQ